MTVLSPSDSTEAGTATIPSCQSRKSATHATSVIQCAKVLRKGARNPSDATTF